MTSYLSTSDSFRDFGTCLYVCVQYVSLAAVVDVCM